MQSCDCFDFKKNIDCYLFLFSVEKISDSVSSFSDDMKKFLLPNGKIPKVSIDQ